MTDTDRLAALLHDLEATQHFVRHEPADGYVTDGPTEIIECSTGVEGHLEDAADLIAAGVTLLDEERLARVSISRAEAESVVTLLGMAEFRGPTTRGHAADIRERVRRATIARAYREGSDDLDCGCKHDGTQTLWLCDTHAATTATMARAYREDSDD